MRGLAIVCPLLLVGCASVPAPSPHHEPFVVLPPATTALERPWLMPMPTDEIKIFDTRTLQALRRLDELPALNQNGGGRDVKVGLWVGIGVGAVVGLRVAEEAAEEIGESLFEAFPDCVFGGCDEDD